MILEEFKYTNADVEECKYTDAEKQQCNMLSDDDDGFLRCKKESQKGFCKLPGGYKTNNKRTRRRCYNFQKN